MCGINYSKVFLGLKKFDIEKNTKKIEVLLQQEELSKALELLKKFRNNYVFISIVKKEKKIIHHLNSINNLIKKLEKKK